MIIQSTRVYIASTLMPAQIEIEDGKIKAVYEYNEKPVDKDYGDLRIVPGFYDLHTHGYHGYDATAGGKDGCIMVPERFMEKFVSLLQDDAEEDSHQGTAGSQQDGRCQDCKAFHIKNH